MLSREDKRQYLESLYSQVDFMAQVSGPNCEVVLRDFHDGESEILYIVNGSISGRHVGERISGFMLKKIMREDYHKTDYVSNYLLVNEQDQKLLRASTYYIKRDGELYGLLCVNYDVTGLMRYRDFLNESLFYGLGDFTKEETDFVAKPLDELVDSMIRQVVLYWDREIPLARVDLDQNPIRQLYQLKLFQYKGTVSRVSELLNISTQSIYRYIKEIDDLLFKEKQRQHELNMVGKRRAKKNS
ncbi:MAG: PAS domain-containing protein [Eubacteriales bacterium]|nr:PAS domain-containing protein [Eubacteriales bacterium]